MTPERVVLIFGLAGSGKSTLANEIGRHFGLRVVHASGIMRDLMENKKVDLERTRHNEGYWESDEGAKLLTDRLSQAIPVDVAANQMLLQEVDKGQVVIDSWALPWLTDKGAKIHLLADLSVRAQRAAQRAQIPYSKALDLISQKDEQTRQLFQRLYGFDLMRDHQVFHHTVDTNKLSAAEVFARTCDYLNRCLG